MLFGKKQEQLVNFNQLLDQMREGEEARLIVNRLCNYLHSCFELNHKRFQEELANKSETSVFYNWSYPFKVFESEDVCNFAEIMGYALNEADKAIFDEDWEQAVKHNRKVEENKNQEEC